MMTPDQQEAKQLAVQVRTLTQKIGILIHQAQQLAIDNKKQAARINQLEQQVINLQHQLYQG